MPRLTRRTQLLLDEDRQRRLEQRAQESGRSVAALIREAIDVVYPDGDAERARAGREFLREADADPIEVGDWTALKRELRDEMSKVEHYR